MKIIKTYNGAGNTDVKKPSRRKVKKNRLLSSSAIEGNSNQSFIEGTNYKELLYVQVPEIKTNKDCVKLMEQNSVTRYKITDYIVIIEFKDFSIKLDRKKNEFIIKTDETN